VNLQEALQVQVRHLLLVRRAQKLREGGVGQDTALELLVETAVALHVVGDELRHLRLRALGSSGNTHERSELIADRALTEEGVVRATGLPDRAGLGGERRRVNLHLALGLTGLALHRLRRRSNIGEESARGRRQGRLEGLHLALEASEDRLNRASLGHGLDNSGRGNRGDNDLGLGGRGLTSLLLGGGCNGGNRGGDDLLGISRSSLLHV